MTTSGPRTTERPPIEIALLCFPGAQWTCVHGLSDLFTYADYFARMHVANAVAATPCPATPSDTPFLRVTQWRQRSRDGDFECADESAPRDPSNASLVIVPASQEGPPPAGFAPRLPDLLARSHAAGSTIAAVCGGVFLVAESGLLDGRPATTHWMFAAELEQRFPAVRVNPDRLVIDDGDVITAGGVLAWADMGLTLVERLLGRTVMCSTARFMLMDPPGREQRLYGEFRPPLMHGDTVILAVQHWLQANVATNVSSVALADRARLGARTFLRRFVRATGMTPTEYQQRMRIARSRDLLEFSRDTVEQIAASTGYEDPRGFRRVFKRVIGLSPVEYRRRFQHAARGSALRSGAAAATTLGAADPSPDAT